MHAARLRIAYLLTGLGVCLVAVRVAADEAPADAAPASPKRDYADFSRLIQKIVVKDLPKEFEQRTNWGNSVPLTERLRFPNLPRTKVRVGDREGYADGLWRKYKIRIDDPAKDVKIDVREFSKLDPKTFHLVLDADISFTGEGEVQHWQKGLPLGRLSALADAVLGLGLAFDIGVTLNTKKFPPELNVEPKLTDLQVDLKDLTLRRVANPTTGIALEGEAVKQFGDDMKDSLRALIKNFEPEIKARANEAIAQSLKEGRGNISASLLFKSAPPAKAKDKVKERD